MPRGKYHRKSQPQPQTVRHPEGRVHHAFDEELRSIVIGLGQPSEVIVAIEGSIGAGKSTTAQQLAIRLGWSVVQEETTKHPFLADFYTDPARYAIETELGFVLLHYHQIKLLVPDENYVADFSPAKDLPFARLNLVGERLNLFLDVFNALAREVPRPRLAIYLDLPLEVLQSRIASRGRPYELGVTADYLRSLRMRYMEDLDQLGEQVEILSLEGTESREAVAARVYDLVRESLFGETRLL